MFEQAKAFNQPLDTWDVSNVTNMMNMFQSAEVFNQPLNTWDVANVTNMSGMFRAAYNFNQPLDAWNVGMVTTFFNMFNYASAFNHPLNTWDVSSATNMFSMFNNATSFNQPLSDWDVSNVTNFGAMFFYASNFNQNIGMWNLSSANNVIVGGAAPGVRYMLSYSGLNCDNYSATLAGWASATTTPSNLELGADILTYDNTIGAAAHNTLTTSKGWTIIGDAPGCTLPVTFGSFTTVIRNGQLLINWNTLTEINNDYFIVEVSADGRIFKKLTEIKSKANGGNSSQVINYAYSTSLQNAWLLFAMPAFLAIGFARFGRKRKLIFGLALLVILSLSHYSCNKREASALTNKGKVFVRIAQVDIDGATKYSKIILAVNE